MSTTPHLNPEDDADNPQRDASMFQFLTESRDTLDGAVDDIRDANHRLNRQDLARVRREARQAEGFDDRLVGVETQVLIDGEPTTVSDAIRRQPGEAPATTAARGAAIVEETNDRIEDYDAHRVNPEEPSYRNDPQA